MSSSFSSPLMNAFSPSLLRSIVLPNVGLNFFQVCSQQFEETINNIQNSALIDDFLVFTTYKCSNLKSLLLLFRTFVGLT